MPFDLRVAQPGAGAGAWPRAPPIAPPIAPTAGQSMHSPLHRTVCTPGRFNGHCNGQCKHDDVPGAQPSDPLLLLPGDSTGIAKGNASMMMCLLRSLVTRSSSFRAHHRAAHGAAQGSLRHPVGSSVPARCRSTGNAWGAAPGYARTL